MGYPGCLKLSEKIRDWRRGVPIETCASSWSSQKAWDCP